MTNNTLVSIITPVYNGAEFLDDLIKSVLEQDYPYIEHIIIDDGSTDNGATVAVLRKYPHLRWWTRPNKGQYPTMNEGLKAAQGEIVSFISADDYYNAPSAISTAISALNSHPSANIVYGKKVTIDCKGKRLPVQPLIQNGPKWLYGYTGFMSHCTMFIKIDFLLNNDLWFDESLHYNGDLDWIIRIMNLQENIPFLDWNLCFIRHHQQQTTVKKKVSIMEERKTILRKFQLNLTLYSVINDVLRWISIFQKAIYTLEKEGVQGLCISFGNWRGR